MDSSRDIVRKLRENRILQEKSDYTNMDRKELIGLAQDGDQLALRTLLDTHEDFLRMMTRKYFYSGSDSAESDDILQTARLAFWDAIKSYDTSSSNNFEQYAGMIIKRKLSDELRKESAQKRILNYQASSTEDKVAGDDSDTIGDRLRADDLSPEEQVAKKEVHDQLMYYVQNKLSEKERTVIRLYLADYTVTEIAEELDMKYRSVDNTLNRAKGKLKDYFNGIRESRRLRVKESIFTDEEKKLLKSVLDELEESKKTM